MPYWDVIARSFRIAWAYKYLWLIAFFSGEAGGNISFTYSRPITGRTDIASVPQQTISWFNDHAGLVASLAAASIVIQIGFFLLGAICEGATIRASAEHDAERPFGLRLAWTMGLHTFWVIVRFRLLLLALYLPMVVLFAAWVIGLFIALANENANLTWGLALAGLFMFLVFFVYLVYLLFIDRFGSRAVILEERRAVAAIAHAHRLLFKRFDRSLLVLLLAIAIAIAVGVVLATVSAILVLPLLVAIAATAASGSAAFWPVLAITVVVLLPIYVLVGGFLAAQSSTYWTLAFRRLDIDYAPAYAYPAYPPAPAQQQ